MRKIIHQRPDGGLSVTTPVRNTLGEALATDAEIEQRAWDKLPPDAINPQIVDESVIPTDRTFRNAWAHGGTTVSVDMPKAREIHKNKLRELRKPKLEALDTVYLRADEISDTVEKARIATLKQQLRDVTADPGIEAAQTPEALKAVMPNILR